MARAFSSPTLLAATAALALAAPAAADVVTLTNGDALTGTVVSTDPATGDVTLDHPAFGQVALPAEAVRSVSVDSNPAPDPADIPDPETTTGAIAAPVDNTAGPNAPAGTPAKPGLFGTPLFRGWDKTAEAGFTGTDGNSDSMSVYGKLSGTYQDDRDRWLASAGYFYTVADGDETRNQGHAEVTKDWLLPESRWFLFARGRYDYDRHQSYRHRLGAYVGPGFQVFKNDDFTLVARLGVGGTYELDGPAPRGFTPEGLAGLEGTYKLTDRQSVAASTTLFPLLDDLGESRNLTQVAYTFQFDAKLAFKLGLENEYESATEGDAEHNDLKYFGSVAYSW